MSCEALKMTIYIGERDRCDGGLLADALMDVYERHSIETAVLLRGIEGFGIKHRLQTERLLTLSEDLPMLAIAIDAPARIEAALADARTLVRDGLITLERAVSLDGEDAANGLPVPGSETVKLTVHVGRQERAGSRPAYLAVVDCMRRHGLAGASVLLGVDGMAHGVRRRGRFFAGNGEVPLMIVSVGERAAVDRALGELAAMLARPTMTLERVLVCKRDGRTLAQVQEPPPLDGDGLAYWRKLTVYASEQSRAGQAPLYSALVRALRREGAAGATALRGIWGYHGDHRPHGERLWSLRRHVPVLAVVLDTPANSLRWFEIVDELTAETGLVTSELVPALRAAGPGIGHGGLRLAARATSAS
jgi:PII-like signaling protein